MDSRDRVFPILRTSWPDNVEGNSTNIDEGNHVSTNRKLSCMTNSQILDLKFKPPQ